MISNQTYYWCSLNARLQRMQRQCYCRPDPSPDIARLDTWDCLPFPHPPEPVHVCIDCPDPSLTVSQNTGQRIYHIRLKRIEKPINIYLQIFSHITNNTLSPTLPFHSPYKAENRSAYFERSLASCNYNI